MVSSFSIIQPEDGQWKVPKHVVVIYVVNIIYIYPPDSCVRQQIHSNSSLQRQNGDDETYDSVKGFCRMEFIFQL